MQRFLGTAVRMNTDGETMAKALGNSKAVAEKHRRCFEFLGASVLD